MAVAVIIEHPVLRCPRCKEKKLKHKKTMAYKQHIPYRDRWYRCKNCFLSFRTREKLPKIEPKNIVI